MNTRDRADLQADMRAKNLPHKAGRPIDRLPSKNPRGLLGRALDIHRQFIAFVVASAIGLVANLAVFFGLAFAFAGQPNEWVNWYFGGNGWLFLLVTVAFAFAIFPRVRRLKLV